jgi:DNA repair photolyase
MEACLDELDAVGLKCVFLFTVNDYPRDIEPGVPPLAQRLAGFRRLADRLGPESVAWRYDPIILGGEFDPDRHVRCFRTIAAGLNGFTSRVVISFLDFYRKTERRMSDVESEGRRFDRKASEHPRAMDLAERLAGEAKNRGMTLQACCEDARFAAAGAAPGACIDAAWITSAVGRTVVEQRDPGQRPDCLCARSVDIGATDTCIHHCRYCYATGSGAAAEKYRSRHDPSAPALRQ